MDLRVHGVVGCVRWRSRLARGESAIACLTMLLTPPKTKAEAKSRLGAHKCVLVFTVLSNLAVGLKPLADGSPKVEMIRVFEMAGHARTEFAKMLPMLKRRSFVPVKRVVMDELRESLTRERAQLAMASTLEAGGQRKVTYRHFPDLVRVSLGFETFVRAHSAEILARGDASSSA